MVTALTLISDGAAAAMTVSTARHVLTGDVRSDFQVFARLGAVEWLRLAAVGIGLTAIVVGALFGLLRLPVPFLQWSWLSLFSNPKDGYSGANLLISAGASIPIFGIVFLVLFFFNLPRFARNEEETFREGTKNWIDAIPRSLGFGLMHCIVGVPIAAGLALALPGLWFTAEYFRGGVDRSTRVHAFYNMILLTSLLAYVTELTFKR